MVTTMEAVRRISCQAAYAGHPDLLQRYKARADKFIELGQKSLNFVLNVDDLNNHGKVARRVGVELGIYAAATTITQWPVESSGASEVCL